MIYPILSLRIDPGRNTLSTKRFTDRAKFWIIAADRISHQFYALITNPLPLFSALRTLRSSLGTLRRGGGRQLGWGKQLNFPEWQTPRYSMPYKLPVLFVYARVGWALEEVIGLPLIEMLGRLIDISTVHSPNRKNRPIFFIDATNQNTKQHRGEKDIWKWFSSGVTAQFLQKLRLGYGG